jgi:hypothetical protein
MFWLEAKQEHWWEEETMWEARKRRYGTQVSFSCWKKQVPQQCRRPGDTVDRGRRRASKGSSHQFEA